MGLRITADHRVIDAAGDESERLLALGPILRGTYWETIAVPELRGQALRVAETLLARSLSVPFEGSVMMEHMI